MGITKKIGLPSIPNPGVQKVAEAKPLRTTGPFIPKARTHRAEVVHQVEQAENTGALITFAPAHS